MSDETARPKWQFSNTAFLVVGAIAVLAIVARPQSPNVVTAKDGEPVGIKVSGHSELMAAPDTAYVSLGVISREKNSRQAVEKNAELAEAVTAAVKGVGIEEKDIQTRGYSLQPWMKQIGKESKQVGYEVRNTVRVTIRDIKKVSDVVDAGTAAGANTVQGVAFEVGDNQGFERKALAFAVEDARAKAEALAKNLGVKVGSPVSVDEEAGYGWDYRSRSDVVCYSMAPSASAGSLAKISPGELKIEKNVGVTFAISR